MSDKTLDQLIASLKSEGIETAEKEAQRILENARLQADQIVQAAEGKKEALLKEAEQAAMAIQNKGEGALRRAGRDYSIKVRNELLKMFQTVLEEEIRKEFTPELMKLAIVKVIENIGSDVELQLSPELSKELSDYIHESLKSSEKTVSIVESNSVLNGFSVANIDSGWTYSITPEEVAEALRNHLNKNWIDMLTKEA